MVNILENFKNFFGKSLKNLGKLREIFRKISRNNIAKIFEKYFKNFENYCEEFEELFLKILNIISFRLGQDLNPPGFKIRIFQNLNFGF